MIFGLGMIGLLTAEILSMNRSITLTAVERRNNRAEGGRRLGIDVLQSPPGDARFDRVIDTVGSEETLAGAMGCLRLEGTLIEAAWTGNRITGVELGKDFHRKRLTVKASQVSHIPGILLSRWDRERRSARVIEMLKAIRPSKYIGLRYPLEDASAAFERIDRGSGEGGEGGKGGKGEEDLQIVLVP
jgi:threonine dehydrogenase-like Zn-dependent dehydrogenase